MPLDREHMVLYGVYTNMYIYAIYYFNYFVIIIIYTRVCVCVYEKFACNQPEFWSTCGRLIPILQSLPLKSSIWRIHTHTHSSATDEILQTDVAIKKIFNIFGHDREFQKRILREIKILKHFDHENVSKQASELIMPFIIFRQQRHISHIYIYFVSHPHHH